MELQAQDDGRARETIRVGALYVDDEYIYYSTHEETHEKEPYYPLYKYHKENKERSRIAAVSNYVRGIGKDDDSGDIYVVDSHNGQIIKFDGTSLNPVLKSRRVFKDLFGICVTKKFILVCAFRDNKISILDDELNLYREIKHPGLLINPTGITQHDDTYFVTTSAAVVAIDISYEEKSFKALKFKSMVNNGKEESFIEELRGICSDGEYIYVTKSEDCLLCLKYDRKKSKLNLVYKIPNCKPIVPAYNDGTVYFCQEVDARHNNICIVTESRNGEGMGFEIYYEISKPNVPANR